MKYYLHDSNAFSDEKITMLYLKYGYEGLGLFYTALEKLAAQEKPINTEVLKAQLKVGKHLDKIFQYCETLGILCSNNGETFSKQLMNFAEKYRIKNEKNKEKIKQWREKQADTKNVTSYETVRNHSKVKESKVNESKDSMREADEPPVTKNKKSIPTLEEVKEYFILKNIELDAEEFFDYYAARGWVSKGSQIKDWTRCITTWKKNKTKFDATKTGQLPYLTGADETTEIAKINAITDEFELQVYMSKIQFNAEYTALYHTELQKFISWDTMVKCPTLGHTARKIFTAKSINHLLTPATYGQRNKTA